MFDGLASEIREVRDSFAASKQSEVNALRASNRTLSWITAGLVLACIATLAIGGMLMNRMLGWMDETWEMSLGHERRLDAQDHRDATQDVINADTAKLLKELARELK